MSLKPLDVMVDFFLKLPGVGKRTALKYAYYLIEHKDISISDLNNVVSNLENLKKCSLCNNITTDDLCDICTSLRDKSKILVLEDYKDLNVIESLGFYKGYYHILPLKINLVDGIDYSSIDVSSLEKRITPDVKELIIATSLTLEGEVLAKYLEELYSSKVKITRFARGVPFGASISNLDPITLKESFLRRYQYEKD